MLKLKEAGLIDKWLEEHQMQYDGPPLTCHSKSSGKMTLDEFYGYLIWFFVGVTLSVLVLMLETMASSHNGRKEKYEVNSEQ